MRVPQELRPLYGKKDIIRKSLGTSDYSEAKSRLHFEAFKLDSEFREKLKAVRQVRNTPEPNKLPELSDREAHNLVFQFFTGLEKNTQKWWEQVAKNLGEDDKQELLKAFRQDEAAYCGASPKCRPEDGSWDLERFLRSVKLEYPQGSPAYEKLEPLFLYARLENTQRTIDRLRGGAPVVHQALFANPDPKKKPITIRELVEKHREMLINTEKAGGTVKTYHLPGRLLCEILGENTPADEVSEDDVKGLLKLLKRAPSNAVKKYRGRTLEEAIQAADADPEEVKRLAPKTLENYFDNISSIFNFAVTKRYVSINPFQDPYLREEFFADSGDEEDAELFSIDQLNAIFQTPLYTGCVNDGRGYNKPGDNYPRRGRFWLPLISLFHGLRCNEAAQLYTEDVCEEGGIPYFEIRETRADNSKCDKKLKTKQSERRVPIHPELIRIGFLDFVAARRNNIEAPRLFPELPCATTGYFSDTFSKWFGRFKKAALGLECEATFHSFRHHFRTALGDAEVQPTEVEWLGGWGLIARSSEKRYDHPSMARLLSSVRKVRYPGLNLSHLYMQTNSTPMFPNTHQRLIELDD